jgi:hypothetical protein
MSKKPAKSERDVELPDWADDVTPADEVMKKFYAPTGTFRSGPIVGQPAAAPLPEPSAAPPSEEDEETSVAARPEPPEALHAAPERVASASLTPINVAEQDDKRGVKATPNLPDLKAQAPSGEKAAAGVLETRDTATGPVRTTTPETPEGSQPVHFEEFARRWKRYLYPGQMAVMRTLFEMAIAEGKSECFTRYSELAAATKMTRRNCINVMNSLVERGFVTRLEVRNDATGKGIRLRIHTDPLL